jgi:hypothetical protein
MFGKNPLDDLFSDIFGLPKAPESTAEKIFDNFNVVKSFTDNVLSETVTPVEGSLVYCVLLGVEHTGIYVGGNRIVHLDGSGHIESVKPKVFMDRLDGLNQAITIYVSCDRHNKPVGCSAAASRARMQAGNKKAYSLLSDNCHQFSASCLTGNQGVSCSTFSSLGRIAKEEIGFSKWKAWTQSDYQ